MKYEQEIRGALIGNAISLIAEGGFEKATTAAITHSGETVPGVRMNEAYIYRIFGNKEELYNAAFAMLDEEFLYALQSAISAEGDLRENTKEKLCNIFQRAWPFMMRNEQRCRCYVRYYYSTYFKDRAGSDHEKRFANVLATFAPLFKEEADVRSIMHSVLTTSLDFAIRVYNGDLEDNEENVPHIFNVLYCMMMTYFKNDITK